MSTFEPTRRRITSQLSLKKDNKWSRKKSMPLCDICFCGHGSNVCYVGKSIQAFRSKFYNKDLQYSNSVRIPLMCIRHKFSHLSLKDSVELLSMIVGTTLTRLSTSITDHRLNVKSGFVSDCSPEHEKNEENLRNLSALTSVHEFLNRNIAESSDLVTKEPEGPGGLLEMMLSEEEPKVEEGEIAGEKRKHSEMELSIASVLAGFTNASPTTPPAAPPATPPAAPPAAASKKQKTSVFPADILKTKMEASILENSIFYGVSIVTKKFPLSSLCTTSSHEFLLQMIIKSANFMNPDNIKYLSLKDMIAVLQEKTAFYSEKILDIICALNLNSNSYLMQLATNKDCSWALKALHAASKILNIELGDDESFNSKFYKCYNVIRKNALMRPLPFLR